VVSCRRCPRLRAHCREVSRVRRRAFADERYWGRPVPAFGDPRARVLVLGLAPGAHGSNRTGRMFTGDRSGEWLFAALHRSGFANRPLSVARGDGLELRDAIISAACRCAPPGNRPTPEEIEACTPHLDREIGLLGNLSVVVALGGIAWNVALRRATRVAPAAVPRPRPRFAHAAETTLRLRADARPVCLLGSYHPSQQNTFTGRLTREMLDAVLARAAALASSE
jgi:uracil-DNA glycosylase family 4